MRLSLDTGHLTDEELGISTTIRRAMQGLPTPKNDRVKLTRNGNVVRPRAR